LNGSSLRAENGPIASISSITPLPWPARHLPQRAFLVVGQFLPALRNTSTLRRPNERGPTVAQQGPTVNSLAIAATPPTSPPVPGTTLPHPDARPEAESRFRQFPGGSARFIRLPSGVPQRSHRTCGRRLQARPCRQPVSASAGRPRRRTWDPSPSRSRRAP
jgi:hypothetical protein